MHPIRLAALQGIAQRPNLKNSDSQQSQQQQKKVSEIYGSRTFGIAQMSRHLSKDIVETLKKVSRGEEKMTPDVANKVAEAAKNNDVLFAL